MKRRLFTLIELIVVIVIIGVLAAIVVPNISSFKEQAKDTALISNQRNIQTAVDMFLLENDGITPTKEKPILGEPMTLELYGLKPDYIRDLPKSKGVHWWLDYNNTVWGSFIDAPKKVTLSSDKKTLSWEALEGASAYNVYEANTVSGKSDSRGYKLTLLKKVIEEDTQITVNPTGESLYLVSAIDSFGFETVAVKAGYVYEGYQDPDKDFQLIEEKEQTNKPERLIEEVPTGYTAINTVEDLVAMNSNGKYILMENLDLDVAPYNEKTGWNPKSFTGTFEGNGLSIKNLFINKPSIQGVGLFKTLSMNAKIKNLNLENVNVTGAYYVGGLAGEFWNGVTVERISVSGKVVASSSAGGIVGRMNDNDKGNTISQSHVDVYVKAGSNGGGLAGETYTNFAHNTIKDSYAFGKVEVTSNAGGLLGPTVGKLNLTNSYSVVEVVGNERLAFSKYLFPITYQRNTYTPTVFWDYIASKTPIGDDSIKRNTQQMQTKSNFVGWDFDTIWRIDEGKDYPRLRWEK